MARGMSMLPRSPAPALVPASIGGLDMGGAPQKGFPAPVGKSLRIQNLGNLIGMRGAGISKVGGGNPIAHTFNHYGKQPQLEGGDEPPAGGNSTPNMVGSNF